MKWGLICNIKRKKSLNLGLDIYEFLCGYGEVFPELSLGKEIKKRGYSLENINKKSDIVITIGGDGTILRALRTIEKPIFSINSGGMGFLSEVESKYAIDGLKKVIDGKYNIENRSKLKIILDDNRLPDATNEVTIQTAKIAKIMYYQIMVENELLETIGADGVILSTPTGSTSYALSVGGPILDPSVNAILIAPIAPFRLSARPWVVPLSKKINIKILPKSKATKIVIDGQYSKDVTYNSNIIVTGSEKNAKFIRFGESFYQMVRLKLVR
jgi:NAD+ kinase